MPLRARPVWFALAALLLIGLAAPLLWPIDPFALNPAAPLQAPGLAHPLGTDELGRDMLARLIQGGAATWLALPASLLAFALGTCYGLASGLSPRWLDLVLMRALDAVLALPVLLVLMAVAAVVGSPGPLALVLLIGGTAWPGLARLVRNEARALRQRDYVLASQQMGAGPWHVARTHLLPGMAPLLAANAAFLVGDAILALSALSFLGLGIAPPRASWGGLLASGLGYVDLGAWWLVVPPSLLIFLSLLLASMIGEGFAQRSRG